MCWVLDIWATAQHSVVVQIYRGLARPCTVLQLTGLMLPEHPYIVFSSGPDLQRPTQDILPQLKHNSIGKNHTFVTVYAA